MDISNNWSLVISLTSLLISVCAFLEVKNSNKISMYSKKLEIFNDFKNLKYYMSAKGTFAKKAEVQRYISLDDRSKHLFDSKLANDLKQYFDLCFKISDLSDIDKTEEEKIQISKYREEMSKLQVGITTSLEKSLKLS